ncbi:MAG TPA: histidine--tRNA ligase [Anaerolineales bacterium]|nr:histidine--tRNA ligase [Anaerolineales bacterium]
MKNIINSVKGTVDFYPDLMAYRQWMYNHIRAVSESFGYQEYEGPIIEPLELYAAKSGDDLVKKQSFVFEDRGGNMVTLRPELTPSLARMVAAKQNELVFPLRWWSYGPMWRYERPQKGRTREFFQWNIDLIGVDTPEADAEIAAVGASFLKQLGLGSDQVVILINNRALMDGELGAMGIAPENRPEIFRLVDRRDKMSAETWQQYATDLSLSPMQYEELCALLENNDLWRKSEPLVRFFEAMEAMGLRDYTRFAPYIIRGLDYYTGTVFEARDQDEEFRAIFGGGRYDNLVADVGGDPIPATGFAMGDKVIELVLEKFKRRPTPAKLVDAPVLVTVFDSETLHASFALAGELRQSGLKVAVYPETEKLSKQFKYADRIGAQVAVVLGPDELAKRMVSVKDLTTREQLDVVRDDAAETVKKLMEKR